MTLGILLFVAGVIIFISYFESDNSDKENNYGMIAGMTIAGLGVLVVILNGILIVFF